MFVELKQVFVIGVVDHDLSLKDKLVSLMSGYLQETDQKEIPAIEFRSIKTQQYFAEKKSQKEIMCMDGILKFNWISKYNDIIPSVVMLTFSFSAEWPITEWVKKESTVLEYVTKIKNSLHSRDIKLVLIPFRTGGGHQDVYEDRINAMKKRFQLDGRYLTVISTADLAVPVTTAVKRLSKSIREFSMAFYVTHTKRVRNLEKSVKATEPLLIARYNFKVSFLSEFQGQSARALRHYRTAYSALTSLYDEGVCRSASMDVSIYEQAKTLAEWINYKICLLYLRINLLKEASQQLRSHISSFSKPIPGGEIWAHFAWVSDQYVIFAHSLDLCNVSTALIDADRSYYYQNAAIFCTKRQSTFHGIKRANGEGLEAEHTLSHKNKGMVVTSPKYVGGPPQLHDPVLDIASNDNERDVKSIVNYLQRTSEQNVDHKALIIDLLKKALDALGPLQKRRRAMIRYLMAKQFMTQGKYELASMNLNPGIEILSKENWSKPLLSMLRKKIACAFYLGRSKEYAIASMKLIAVANSNRPIASSISRHEREELHRDILSVIFSQSPPSPTYLASLLSDTSHAGVGYVGVTWRPQFGIAATEGHPAEFTLPGQHPIEFSDAGIDLFKVKINFTPITVTIGQPLRVYVTITSLFEGCLSFAEMSLHFTDDILIQRLTHDGSSAGDGTCGAVLPKGSATTDTTGPDGIPFKVPLIFPPKTPVNFTFEIFVPESAIGGYMDAYACLEKIRLVMKIPKFSDVFCPGNSPGMATPLVESVEEIIIDSTKSFEPIARRPSHALGAIAIGDGEAGDMGDINDFVSTENKPLEEADAQFIPEASESEEGGLLSAPIAAEESGDFMQGPPLQRRRTSSSVSMNGATNADFVDESADNMPIITTRERMSSLSHYDLKDEMDNIDIALEKTESQTELPLDGSAVDESEHTFMGNFDSDNAFDRDRSIGDDNDEPDITSDHETRNDSTLHEDVTVRENAGYAEHFLDSPLLDPNLEHGEVADSPFRSMNTNLASETSRISVEETRISELRLSQSLDTTVGLDDNIASAGTPMFGDDKMNKFTVMSVDSADNEAQLHMEGEDTTVVGIVSVNSTDDTPLKSSPITAGPNERDEVKGAEAVGASVAKNVSIKIEAPIEIDDTMYRRVCFDLIAVSRIFREARSSSNNIVLKDIADFVGPHAPKILHVTRPISNLKLLSDTSQPIASLQGMIQRVNLVFSTEFDEILNGKIFLSSDQNTQTPTSSLFWYPDLKSARKSLSAVSQDFRSAKEAVCSARFLEGVSFKPLELNSSLQPAESLHLPRCASRTIFCVPLFLKSDTQGTFSVKLRFEYIPMSVLSTPVSKEFEIKLAVHRPFALNFGFTSTVEAPCGAVLAPTDSSTNQTQWRSVLRGDFINLSASLNCLHSLKHNVEVLALGVVIPSAAKQLHLDPSKPTVESIFQLVDNTIGSTQKDLSYSNRYANLLSRQAAHVGNDCPLVMCAGEKFVGSVEVKCIDFVDKSVDATKLLLSPRLLMPQDPICELKGLDENAAKGSPLQPISIGNISIKWRTGDRFQMSPIVLEPYLDNIPADQRCYYSIESSCRGDAKPEDFAWLLPLGASKDSSVESTGLVGDISRTLICSMTFMVPAIQVLLLKDDLILSLLYFYIC